jgi:protein TonB
MGTTRAIPSASVRVTVAILVLGGMLFAQDAPHHSCDTGRGMTGPVYRVGKDGATAPRIIRTVEPEYTEKARQAKIQGAVLLALLVDSRGNPTMIKVSEGLGRGLDEKATEAMRQWRFEPATIHGKPVAAEICAQVDFRLQK